MTFIGPNHKKWSNTSTKRKADDQVGDQVTQRLRGANQPTQQPVEEVAVTPQGRVTNSGMPQEIEQELENPDEPEPEVNALLAAGASEKYNGRRSTPISNPPPNIALGLPEQFTFKHTYQTQFNKSWNIDDATQGGFEYAGNDLRFRLNSIYDMDWNQNTDTVGERPTWRDYFATLYDYWTVLEMEINIDLDFRGVNASASTPYAEQTVGFEGNPSDWVVLWRDFGNTTYPTPYYARNYVQLLKDPNIKSANMKYKPMGISQVLGTGLNTRQNYTSHKTLKFKFNHNDYLKLTDILQDKDDKIWIPKAEDNPLQHVLRIMFRRKEAVKNPAGSTTAYEWLRVGVRQIITVQWKQLNSTYAFWQDSADATVVPPAVLNPA